MAAPKSYVKEMVELLGLENAKRVGTTGTATSTNEKDDDATILDKHYHKLYRKVVGKQLWLVPVRPDLSYVAKELSRCLQAPTNQDY